MWDSGLPQLGAASKDYETNVISNQSRAAQVAVVVVAAVLAGVAAQIQ